MISIFGIDLSVDIIAAVIFFIGFIFLSVNRQNTFPASNEPDTLFLGEPYDSSEGGVGKDTFNQELL